MGILAAILQTLPTRAAGGLAEGTTAVALVPVAQAAHLLAMLKASGVDSISVEVDRDHPAPARQARIVVLRRDAAAARASLNRLQQP